MAWDESDTEKALRKAYRVERDMDVRLRLHALWLLRSGERRMHEVAGRVGTTYRTVQRWVAWYRTGRLEAVRTHRMGGWVRADDTADRGATGAPRAGGSDGPLSECAGDVLKSDSEKGNLQ